MHNLQCLIESVMTIVIAYIINIIAAKWMASSLFGAKNT